MAQPTIKLIGFPEDRNSSFLRGAALAPPRIRLMEVDGSANTYAELGRNITPGSTFTDLGDIQLMDSPIDEAALIIRSTIKEQLKDGSQIVSLGGDHSVAFPILDAYADAYPGLHVLQIDAHGDLYEDFDGNPHSHASPFARILETGKLTSLTQVGNRSLNPHQREQALRYGVNILEMKDFSYAFIQNLQGPLYISIDLDGLDPAFAPGVSHHEPGGLSSRDLFHILQNIQVPIVGGDIVEYNPTRDHQNMTAMLAYKTMKELMDAMIRTGV